MSRLLHNFHVIAVLVAAVFVVPLPGRAGESSRPITDVYIGNEYRQISRSVGDEWAPTWGRNDILYTANDDGSSFGDTKYNPVAFGKLTGSDAYGLVGKTLNGMDEYRESPPKAGPEGALWKTTDTLSVGSVLYRISACHATESAHGVCLVTSSSRGRSWTQIEYRGKELFSSADLEGATFVTNRPEVEAAEGTIGDYAYAAFHAGVVDGVDVYRLGRVLRSNLSRADPDDWTFKQADRSWQKGASTAVAFPNSMGIGEDGSNWKTMNTYSVDGVLYAFVTRCHYPIAAADPLRRHVFQNSSVIMSKDNGQTWIRSARDNLAKPMFLGTRFGAPYFVWYGQDGKGAADNADAYIYAISNNGHFEGGDDYILGRVRRAQIQNLHAADWSFFKGGDGMADGGWTSRMSDATPVLADAGRAGMTGMTYISALRRYVMVVWHYTQVSFQTAVEKKDMSTVLEFFEAPKPWGPWLRVRTFETGQLGWYAPVIGQRFQTSTASNSVEAFLYTTGFKTKPEGGLDWSLYKMTYLPIVLSTNESVKVSVARRTEP